MEKNERKTIFDFLTYGFIKILILCTGWIANIFIARKLSVNDYGIISLFMTVSGLFSSIVVGWTNAAFLYYGLKEKKEKNTLSNSFWTRICIVGFMFCLSVIIILLIRGKLSSFVGISCHYEVMAWIVSYFLVDFISTYFLILGKNFLSNLTIVTTKLSLVMMVLLMNLDVQTVIWIYFFSQLSAGVLLIKINKNDIQFCRVDKKWFKSFASFSIYEFFGFIGIYLINYCDILIINFFYDNEAVAKYNIAYSLFSALVGLSYTISNFFSKVVADSLVTKNRHKLFMFFYRTRFWILLLVLGLHIVAYFLIPLIVCVLYGLRYVEVIGILRILLIASFFGYMQSFYIIYYNCKLDNKKAQIINILQSIFNIIFDIIFIKFMGNVKGAAWGTVMAYIVGFAMLGISYERSIYQSSREKLI